MHLPYKIDKKYPTGQRHLLMGQVLLVNEMRQMGKRMRVGWHWRQVERGKGFYVRGDVLVRGC